MVPWEFWTDDDGVCAALLVDLSFCCAAKLVPVGFGIKKLQITAVIEDSKIESMDAIIEEEIVKCVQSLRFTFWMSAYFRLSDIYS